MIKQVDYIIENYTSVELLNIYIDSFSDFQ